MGFKEELITDWKDKTIEYQGKKFYIIEEINFKGKTYMYGCDIDTIDNKNVEVVFLTKVKDNIFEHVENNALFEELLANTSAKILSNKIKEIYNKYIDKK